MSEKIRYDELRKHHFADILFIRAIVRNKKLGDKIPHEQGQPFEVCLTINGIVVPFVEAVDELQKSLDDVAGEMAAEMIRGKTESLDGTLMRLEDGIKALIRDELKGYVDDGPEYHR